MNFKSERYQLFATTLASSGENIEVQVNQVQRESGRLVGSEPITAQYVDAPVYIYQKMRRCKLRTSEDLHVKVYKIPSL